MAKAKIIIVSAEDEFTQEQKQFIKRMLFCLQDHHRLSAKATIKESKIKTLKAKVA
jgi:hypothetical protein